MQCNKCRCRVNKVEKDRYLCPNCLSQYDEQGRMLFMDEEGIYTVEAVS